MAMLKQNNHYEIYIDKDGIWYFRGAEMKRRDIVQYFYRYLRRDGEGNYLIEIEDDRCYVGVEDAPYVIRTARPALRAGNFTIQCKWRLQC